MRANFLAIAIAIAIALVLSPLAFGANASAPIDPAETQSIEISFKVYDGKNVLFSGSVSTLMGMPSPLSLGREFVHREPSYVTVPGFSVDTTIKAFAGVLITVTPRVAPDGGVTLNTFVTVSKALAAKKGAEAGSLPEVVSFQAQQTTTVKWGEAQVVSAAGSQSRLLGKYRIELVPAQSASAMSVPSIAQAGLAAGFPHE